MPNATPETAPPAPAGSTPAPARAVAKPQPAAGPPASAAGAPATPAAGSSAATGTVAPVEPKQRPWLLRMAAKAPFTTAYVLVTLVLSVVLGTLWESVEQKSWFDVVGYGLPAFQEGRWYTLITGNFFALIPVYYIFVAGAFAVITGFAETRLGTVRTVVITVGGQIVAVLLTALLFRVFRDSGWDWAAQRSTETDVGFSAGMMAAISVASATVRPPWRLRLRLLIWVYVLYSVLFIGQMADAEHSIAVLLSMPFSTRLAGRHGLRARALPTRFEVRQLAFALVAVSAVSQLLSTVLPDRLTPFGPTDDESDAWWVLVILLVITLLVANGIRRGYRWAWWLQVLLQGVTVLFGVVVGVFAVISWFASDITLQVDDPGQFVANMVFSLLLLVLLIVFRDSFRVPRRSRRRLATASNQPEKAKELLRRWGGDTISWMTTWPENRQLVTADGESYVAYRRHAGVAVALGDPVGPREATADTLKAFIAACDKAGIIPYMFSCTERTTAVTDALGWHSVQVAEDNLIDLPTLEFKGKKWQDIRTALNKAPKEGISFRMVTLADEPWSMVNKVENISAEWLGEKKLPEMGFTLGGLTEALDPEVRVGLAVDAAGTVHGVTSWMPVYGEGGVVRGWTLDLMRRGPEGSYRAAMEFLIASSCLFFKAEGAEFVSLSGAPLARSDNDAAPDTAIEKLMDSLGAQLEPVYGFRSLHQFKAKFQPRLSPIYMAYRDDADLPRIGIAITRAYLPTAGVGDMLAVVKH
ncbi:bifunctional lysylphosphatidylglycerol flippase/synthetase MprF [Nakamurella deserti]|uniref:bifunctional lysylphosphatidylglycerol flippase/synthetase MprF n=1 Tax=Nakamurella deserti TaxID=2164074 RepID=UPI00197C72D0|nr:DUF2156 domain-containing protein [Nakamurella deserti]